MRRKIVVEIKSAWLISYLEEIKERNGMSFRETVEECIADAALKKQKTEEWRDKGSPVPPW